MSKRNRNSIVTYTKSLHSTKGVENPNLFQNFHCLTRIYSDTHWTEAFALLSNTNYYLFAFARLSVGLTRTADTHSVYLFTLNIWN